MAEHAYGSAFGDVSTGVDIFEAFDMDLYPNQDHDGVCVESRDDVDREVAVPDPKPPEKRVEEPERCAKDDGNGEEERDPKNG